MRRIAVIMSAILFLALNLGIGIRVHYCGDRISKVVLFGTPKGKTCCGIKSVAERCCSDKYIHIKGVEENEQVSNYIIKYQSLAGFIPAVSCLPIFDPAQSDYLSLHSRPLEPDWGHPPLYLQYRVFRL